MFLYFWVKYWIWKSTMHELFFFLFVRLPKRNGPNHNNIRSIWIDRKATKNKAVLRSRRPLQRYRKKGCVPCTHYTQELHLLFSIPCYCMISIFFKILIFQSLSECIQHMVYNGTWTMQGQGNFPIYHVFNSCWIQKYRKIFIIIKFNNH